jgi:uncharacterized membrane-anchored protein
MVIQEKTEVRIEVADKGVIISKKPPIWKLLLTLLPQFFLFSFMIAKQEYNRYYATPIYLELTRPRDPRDLFMGEYVQLHYEIAQRETVNRLCSHNTLRDGITLYFTLQKNEAKGVWEPIKCSDTPPEDTPIFVKGRYVAKVWEETVEFGIEKFFVPEGKGWTVESQLREAIRNNKIVKALILLGRDGTPSLSTLFIENNPLTF